MFAIWWIDDLQYDHLLFGLLTFTKSYNLKDDLLGLETLRLTITKFKPYLLHSNGLNNSNAFTCYKVANIKLVYSKSQVYLRRLASL